MHALLIAVTVLMALGMGWSIGANDAANAMGTAVGSRVVTLRQAIALVAVFGFLGAALQGGHVSRMIGRGIVDLTALPGADANRIALVGSFASCLWVVLATHWKMPISTSHSVVGAVAGAGVAMHCPVKWHVLWSIFACWVFTPAGAAVLGFVLYAILRAVLPLLVPRRYERRTLALLILGSGCYVAYSWGANDVANATGLLQGAGILPGRTSVILGGAAIVVGILTWGYKVIDTIGSGIAHLTPLMALAAQLASAANVHLYTLAGIPVSTSHSIVGAIFGVGVMQGVRVINLRVLGEIVFCWLATPLVAGALSYACCKAVQWVVAAL